MSRGAFAFVGLLALAHAAETNESERRTVRHALGETRVPARVTRVVTLSYESTESALALGLVPVGAVGRTGGGFFPNVAGELGPVREVGDEDAPDLAAVAALRPDLILGVKLRHAAIFPALSQIAPTVLCETLRGQWRSNLRLWGDALGRPQAAAEALADWERRIAVVRHVQPEAPRTRLAVVRFMPGMLRIYHEDSFAMSILAEAGFAPSEFRAGNNFFEELPESRLPELNSTAAIFYFTWDDGTGHARQRERAIITGAAWNRLPAAAAKRAFRVDDGVWNTGGGIISARRVLAELRQLLSGPAR